MHLRHKAPTTMRVDTRDRSIVDRRATHHRDLLCLLVLLLLAGRRRRDLEIEVLGRLSLSDLLLTSFRALVWLSIRSGGLCTGRPDAVCKSGQS